MTGIFSIFLACLFWALDTLIRYPLLFGGVSAVQIVFFEHALLVLGFFAFMLWRGRSTIIFQRQYLSGLVVVGGIGSALSTLAFTEAFNHINPTLVILLQKLQPIVAIIAAWWLLKEILPRFFVLWAALAIGGSVVMIAPDVLNLFLSAQFQGYGGLRSTLIGYGFTLLAAIGWGLSTVFGKQLLQRGLQQDELMYGRFLFALFALLPLVLSQLVSTLSVSADTIVKVAGMVLLAGLLGMSCYYYGLKRVPAHVATLAELFFPVAATLVNWLFLGQVISMHHIIGATLLTLGAVMAQLQPAEDHSAVEQV